MTTFIDDGLVESCFEDPDPVIDLDQFNVIDVDNINAVIEDPGYILDEAPNNFNQDEVYTYVSSYRKRSSTLPVTFFDISRNISLLKRCRPISVKIVDCDIYPWYYKRKKCIKNNNSDLEQQFKRKEDSNVYKMSYNITKSSICYDTEYTDQVCSSPRITSHKINLSSEQRAAVLKLKEEIGKQTYTNKVSKGIVESLDNNKPTLNYENMLLNDKNVTESRLNKSIDLQDFLAYKEIAQTIVRNIDNNKTDNSIQNAITQDTSKNIEKLQRKKSYEKKEQKGNTSTSPILPYTVNRQKKAKPKMKMLGKSSKADNNLKKCCKTMSTIDQLIPHYHWPVSEENNNNLSSTNKVANCLHYQDAISNDPSLNKQQHCKQSDVLSGSSNSVLIDNCRVSLPTSTSSNELYNGCSVNSSLVASGQFYETRNPNFHRFISDRQSHYPSLLHYQNTFHSASKYPSQPKIINSNSLRFVRRPLIKQVSKENFRVYSQNSINSKKLPDNIPDSNSLNNNVNYSTAQIPLQRIIGNRPNVAQTNPLLSQILNYNGQSQYHQLAFQQQGYLSPGSVMERSPILSMSHNFWPPPRPLLPPCSFEYNYSLTQLSQNESFLYPNTGTNFQYFPNVDYANASQHKTNLNHTNLDVSPNESTTDLNNIKSIPVDPPNVTITMSPKIDSINRSSGTETQKISQVTSESHGITDPKVKIPQKILKNHREKKMVGKKQEDYNRQNVIKVFAEPGKTTSDKTKNLEPKNIGYSPPILPIPSFKRSLEILSELKHSPVKQCNNSDLRKNHEINNIIRKRKLTDDEKTCINSKRISLEEYKLRRSENVIRIM